MISVELIGVTMNIDSPETSQSELRVQMVSIRLIFLSRIFEICMKVKKHFKTVKNDGV